MKVKARFLLHSSLTAMSLTGCFSSALAQNTKKETPDRTAEASAEEVDESGRDTKTGKLSGTEADIVTVTGLRVNAPRRSSSPISIVTAADIQQKQVTNITDLLRGEIPGIFVVSAGANDWTTKVFARGNTSWNYETSDLYNDYAKIFIDGVELSRPTLLSTIDPSTIERVEMVRGPQAGIIYGTEGSNGLMKIVTKKGATGRQGLELIAQASAGIMESEFTPDNVTPIVQDHSLQLIGGDDNFGYRLGGNYQTTGEWTPNYNAESYALSGGIRAQRDAFTISLSGFYNNRDLVPFANMTYPMRQTLVATTIGYQASPDWHHTLTIGQDINSFGYRGLNQSRGNSYTNTDYARRTLRYFTSYDTKLSPDFSAIFSGGGDIVLYDAETTHATGVRYVNGRFDLSTAATQDSERQVWRNFGYFGMAEFGYRDQLYLTVAARVEEGLRYVEASAKRQVQPRLGLSYVLDQGPATIKLRGQWGRSVRAPITNVLDGSQAGSVRYLPTNIGPEVKEGWDAGIDLSWRGLGSLSVTYFDEKGRNLIMAVGLDGSPQPQLIQYQNFGVITNKGWELNGTANFGPVSLRGNLTITDNRIRKISDLEASYGEYTVPGRYTVGMRMMNVPNYSGGITTSLRVLDGSISANTSFLGPRRVLFDGVVAPLWRVNLRAEKPIADGFTVFGRVDNLTKNQKADEFDFAVAPGRTWVLGFRKTLGLTSPDRAAHPVGAFGRSYDLSDRTPSRAGTASGSALPAMVGHIQDLLSNDIVVTAPYQRDSLDVLSGTSVLSGAELTRNLRPTIGETLARQPGVSATSFGPNASRPVLRGLQGERIRILTDGIGSVDVSNTSVDHAVVINPLTAERIEVLRGPAALLFGSSAIGGVVNVIDNRIPRRVPDEQAHLDAITNYGSAADETSISAVLNMPLTSNLVLHADGSYVKTADLRTGGNLYTRAVRDGAAQYAAENDKPQLLADSKLRGRLPNTAGETSEYAGGLSYIGGSGSLGFVISRYDSLYGVPTRLTFNQEPAEVPDHTHGGDPHTGVRLDARQTRVDVRGELESGGFIDRIRVRAAGADYRHDEIEANGGIGTSFFNRGYEGRVEAVQAKRGGWNGAIGGQFFIRNFRVDGAEKFLPKSNTQQYGLFTLQSLDLGALRTEAGARYEYSNVRADKDLDLGIPNTRRRFNALSFSLGGSLPMTDDIRVGVNASHTERAPSAEELFANGPHLGTQAFEVGNSTFGKEASWGLEATLKGRGPGYRFAASAYHNWFSNYIYDYQTGGTRDGLPIYQYAQADARYYGLEGEFSATLTRIGRTEILGDILADYVHATVADSSPAPRIPPLRVLGGIEARSSRLGGRAEVERVFEQDRIASYETATKGYTMVNLSTNWTPFPGNATSLVLSVNNLFDVEARRHSSVLKDYAPLSGRDVRLTARFQL